MFANRRIEPRGGARFSAVFVIGVARCGSTLLGRLLDMHSRVWCGGELMRIDLAVENGRPCGCGALVGECEFWRERLPRLRAETGLDYRRFQVATYAGLARELGKDVAVDLSKTRVWRRARWWGDRGEGYILLVRDARGTLGSALRDSKDLEPLLAKHVKWMERLTRFAERKGERALVVHYEDLCREPRAELERVCAFLGLAFEPQMLRPAEALHHFVHSSASGYLRATSEIRLDERWRQELTGEQIARIEQATQSLRVARGRQIRAQ